MDYGTIADIVGAPSIFSRLICLEIRPGLILRIVQVQGQQVHNPEWVYHLMLHTRGLTCLPIALALPKVTTQSSSIPDRFQPFSAQECSLYQRSLIYPHARWA